MICKPLNISSPWKNLNLNFNSTSETCNKSQNIHFSSHIYTDVAELPSDWDIIAGSNILLSRKYLAGLQQAAPDNMMCHFIGMYKNNKLCGVVLAQYLNLSAINTIPEWQGNFCIKDFLFRKFSFHVIIIGNNTITGQNAFLFSDDITNNEAIELLQRSVKELVNKYHHKGINIDIITIKDFNDEESYVTEKIADEGYSRFSTQPNMIFSVIETWHYMADYVADLNTKYRTQYNRCRKKAEGILKRNLSEAEISMFNERIYELYLTVVNNASFNTFHLPKNHFEALKQQLEDDLILYGYFQGDQLIGFSTLIKNKGNYNAYFLGYDANIQKEKMLYLNMLYDMIEYVIENKGKQLQFGRSAMEIKSSVGAQAKQVHGCIKHNNPLINPFIPKLFNYFEPKVEWKERNPFK